MMYDKETARVGDLYKAEYNEWPYVVVCRDGNGKGCNSDATKSSVVDIGFFQMWHYNAGEFIRNIFDKDRKPVEGDRVICTLANNGNHLGGMYVIREADESMSYVIITFTNGFECSLDYFKEHYAFLNDSETDGEGVEVKVTGTTTATDFADCASYSDRIRWEHNEIKLKYSQPGDMVTITSLNGIAGQYFTQEDGTLKLITEEAEMLKIETPTLINGNNIEDLSNAQIGGILRGAVVDAKEADELAKETKSTTLKADAKAMRDDIETLRTLLDERDI